jgi:hypothetical protein
MSTKNFKRADPWECVLFIGLCELWSEALPF